MLGYLTHPTVPAVVLSAIAWWLWWGRRRAGLDLAVALDRFSKAKDVVAEKNRAIAAAQAETAAEKARTDALARKLWDVSRATRVAAPPPPVTVTPPPAKPTPQKPVTKGRKTIAVEELLNQGWGDAAAIAEEVGCTPDHVRNVSQRRPAGSTRLPIHEEGKP